MDMGHLSPNHQWDKRKHVLFLLTPMWAEGTSTSLSVLHRRLLVRKYAREVRVWVKVEDRAHRTRLQGPRGVSMLWYRRLSL